jgi:hypothetical protein
VNDKWGYYSTKEIGEEKVIKIEDAYEASAPMQQLRAAGVGL